MRLVHRLIRLTVVGLLFVGLILPLIVLFFGGLWVATFDFLGQIGLWGV